MPELPASMRAVIIENIGRPRALKDRRAPLPQIASDEALVRVHATSVNRSDLLYRSGALIIRKPLPHILGGDLAGEIAALGDDSGDWKVGDRVAACFGGLGSDRDGGYAEYCALPLDQLVRLPDALDYQTAAAAGMPYADAFSALVRRGNVHEADRVVIFDAETCLGIAATQIAKSNGAQVIAISQNEYAADLHAIGADVTLDAAGSDLVRQVKVATDELGATLALQATDVTDLAPAIDMLAVCGQLIVASAQRRPRISLDLATVYDKSLSLHGVRESIAPADYAAILEAVADGVYAPVVDESLPLSQARQAHQKLERAAGFGKITLTPDAILEAAKKPANWIPID